jgi:hypothetical protein
MENDDFIPDTRTDAQRAESYRYWATKTDAEKWAETVRLSVERYGVPVGDLRDGPFRKYRINPDGTRTLIRETCGPNPLRKA